MHTGGQSAGRNSVWSAGGCVSCHVCYSGRIDERHTTATSELPAGRGWRYILVPQVFLGSRPEEGGGRDKLVGPVEKFRKEALGGPRKADDHSLPSFSDFSLSVAARFLT